MAMVLPYNELVSVEAHVAASPSDHITLKLHAAGWPEEAESYEDPGSK